MAISQIISSALVILTVMSRSHAADTNRPLVAIYTSDGRWTSERPEPQVIAALWADGQIIWSATNSGRPYRQGRFSPDKLNTLLAKLDRKGVFTNQSLARPNVGPDSSFTTIAIDDGRRQLKMESWHEFFERNTNLVATASGIEPLAGRVRERVLQGQPAEYRNYRSTWSEIRQAVTGLIPATGEAYKGEIPISNKR